jgi:serine/threonine-protein kinase
MGRVEAFLERYDLPPSAREELERMLSGYGVPVVSLPDQDAHSTLMFDPEDLAEVAASDGVDLGSEDARERYEDLAFIGRGSFAEVRRVRDKGLNRLMAMKILDRDATDAAMRARFVQEAQATAQLQHPGIVPVHELGVLPDGRPFFTMEEVRGRTLSAVVDAVHAVSADVWGRTADEWTLRRLVEVFRRVTEAVAFAHSRGVLHRDLKPANVMVGAFGEVRVMDWGIARIVGSALPSTAAFSSAGVAGTPAYMAPEQARGHHARIDRRTDVYALGAILYHILSNRPPFAGETTTVLAAVAEGQSPATIGRSGGPMLPDGLVQIVQRAMAPEPSDRFPHAGALGDAVASWLEGAERRSAALEAVGRAAEERRSAKVALRRARRLREAAALELSTLPTHAPVEAKTAAWEKQDQATALEREARLHELDMERELNAAFAFDAELPEGHLMMARVHRQKHAVLEAGEDRAGARRTSTLLRRHLDALPADWPGRERLAAYLEGTGRLQLATDRPMEAHLFRLEARSRRIQPVRVGSLGSTPVDRAVPMGRYLLELTDELGEFFRVPFVVRRQEVVIHQPPGEEPQPLVLPDDLEGDEVAVPAGWFEAGGDDRAPYGMPRRRLWCHAFAIAVFPVTHDEWLLFLEDDGTDAHVPRNDDGDLLYTATDAGWSLSRPDGRTWLRDSPVTHITWHSAEAYAAWKARRDGVPWRLPFELEWEKAARGVDGRAMPWGDHVDAAFCNLRGSLAGPPELVEVGRFPLDCSVYGVRGLGGNSADWCADAYESDGPVVAGERVVLDEGAPQARFRSVRGGSYRDGPEAVRCASRWRALPSSRSGRVGVRLVRSL